MLFTSRRRQKAPDLRLRGAASILRSRPVEVSDSEPSDGELDRVGQPRNLPPIADDEAPLRSIQIGVIALPIVIPVTLRAPSVPAETTCDAVRDGIMRCHSYGLCTNLLWGSPSHARRHRGAEPRRKRRSGSRSRASTSLILPIVLSFNHAAKSLADFLQQRLTRERLFQKDRADVPVVVQTALAISGDKQHRESGFQ